MSGAFPSGDCALMTPAQSGALPANTAVFRNARRETGSFVAMRATILGAEWPCGHKKVNFILSKKKSATAILKA
jgi:hypothetical protein